MNCLLKLEIIKHIYARFMLIPSTFINFEQTKSLLSKDFLLDEVITYNTINEGEIQNKVYGASLQIDKQEINILSFHYQEDEISVLIKFPNGERYGLSAIVQEPNNIENYYSWAAHSIILVSLDGKSWMECSTQIQADLLSSLEKLKNFNVTWKKCENKESFKDLLSFIDFYDEMY